jgi:signal transduction histidine kinase/ActR/RegA family two-component response regulator
MTAERTVPLDERILIFAPVGKDAPLTLDVLSRAGLPGTVCETASSLCSELMRGGSVILLTEEALEDRGAGELMECLRTQPAWSDIPVLLFADAERSEVYLRTLRLLEGLRNVVLLERPIRLGAALSLIRSAIRGRQRQYEVRDLLKDLADAREEAERANRLKDEFLATLSHELRTPLNAILGWTAMVRDGNVQPKHAARALETIYRNAMAQVQIVNDLLDVSRIVRGNLQLEPRLMPLNPLMAASVDSVTPAADAKGVAISVAYPREPLLVWGDQDRLQQVLWNLLSNAVKFTPPGGRIDVNLDAHEGDARIRIADNGSGIAPEFLPHVFERFRQADGSATRAHGGLGLGLAIVSHLVELHGGRLTAESEGEGRGSTFTVYLPSRACEPRTELLVEGADPRAATRALDLDGVHVLIVDDEPDALELLQAMLSVTGARITRARSAREALSLFGEDPPDILLADVAMPGQDGYTLMRSIRALPLDQGARVKAIAVSAYARREDRQRAINAGFDRHLAKPLQPDDLLEAIEGVWTAALRPAMTSANREAEIH